jgi:hypothetical protein
MQVLERLSAYLPEEQRSRQALLDLAHSPQFQQQLATFSGALQTGQLDLAQFGLQAQVNGGFCCFCLIVWISPQPQQHLATHSQ